MRKNGYTIIELVIVINILLITFAISIGGYKIYKRIYDDIQVNQFKYEIEDTLSYGRRYSRSVNRGGTYYILFENKELKVIYECFDGKSIKTVLPSIIKVYPYDKYALNISKEGDIDSYTIKFEDIYGKKYILSVATGVSIIAVRDDE